MARLFSAPLWQRCRVALTAGLGSERNDPLASPVHGELTGFLPTLILASTLDDSGHFAQRLSDARIEVQLHLVSGVPHVLPALDPEAQVSRAACAAIARFIAGIDG